MLRVLAPPNPFTPLLPLRPYVRMEVRADLPGLSSVARHTTNRWGLRGEDPPPDWDAWRTVIAVGGSTTHGFYLDDDRTWPARLQARLRARDPRTWVGNGGIDGQTTRAHRVFVDEVVAVVRPDVVLFLVGANDLALSLDRAQLAFGNPFDRAPRSRAWALACRSRVLQALWLRALLARGDVVRVPRAIHEPFQPRPLAGEDPLPEDLDTLLPQLEEFRGNVRALVRATRAAGAAPMFTTQPLLFDQSEVWRRVEGTPVAVRDARVRISAATQWRLLSRYNQVLLDTCITEGAWCVDLAARLGHDPRWFYDSLHFTESGAEAVAEALAPAVYGILGGDPGGDGRGRTTAAPGGSAVGPDID